jgi:hypothetical protein
MGNFIPRIRKLKLSKQLFLEIPCVKSIRSINTGDCIATAENFYINTIHGYTKNNGKMNIYNKKLW